MVFDFILNPIFSPLLKLPTLLAVILLSFLISVIITVIYKYTTDQNLMKQLKEEMKEYQKKIKELRKEPEKAMEMQKKAMQSNMKYMTQSLKSTLYSFIPIILIFGWMSAHFAFMPIQPQEDFTITLNLNPGVDGTVTMNAPDGVIIRSNAQQEISDGKATWKLKGEAGEYLIGISVDGKKYDHEILIDGRYYKTPIKKIKDDKAQDITTNLQKNIILNLFGWKLGWLATYIIFALMFSIIVRKAIKVY